MADETISEKCETLYNKLNTFVASVISRDVTPKISNLNTEVWGSDTQTGNSRIDTLNTNFNNLDSSITSMESDINNVESDVSNLQTSVNSLNTSITNKVDTIYSTTATCNSNLAFTRTTTVNFRRIGNIVIADLWNAECKPTSIGWRNFVGIPSGYRPVADIFIAVTSNATQIRQASTISGRTSIRAYVSAVPTSNISFGFLGVWATSDDYPSQ